MSAFISMKCTHCWGTLEHKFRNLWHCPYCNADSSFVTGEDDIEKISFGVKHNRKICTHSVIKALIIKARDRKRTTVADMFPMDIVFNIDGREIIVAEEVENIGKGKIFVNIRPSRVLFYSGEKNRLYCKWI